MHLPYIPTEEYNYHLPEERISNVPSAVRDESKLLVYNQGTITHGSFKDIPQHLPSNTLLIFNNTKVFPARLYFQKSTGAIIEIFCLQAISSVVPTANGFSMEWQCMIGNAKKWKAEEILKHASPSVSLTAQRIGVLEDAFCIRFEWQGESNFFAVLEQLAELPLPPYMKRRANATDKERYQTVYAEHLGSVAAPTAGLHFTPAVMEQLAQQGCKIAQLTLHVGAGTFKPITALNAAEHKMHSEQFVVTRSLIEALLEGKKVVCVGTTSTRVIESLYWLGIRLLNNPQSTLMIEQWDPYQQEETTPVELALKAILKWMDENQTEQLSGSTRIFILPTYRFRIIKGLVTNFHQPQSTLMLLVAALVGEDWKNIYQYALDNDFRFLSYGDSSLLLP